MRKSLNKTCLIVGAGLAGLTAASELRACGWEVTIVDKGRSVGGRLATRRLGSSRLDHGAQFFTTRSEEFIRAVATWELAGWVEPWYSDEGHTRYKGIGGMNALAKHLASPFLVRTETRVQTLAATSGRWHATAESGEVFDADALILTPPAPQAAALLADLVPDISETLHRINFAPCFALLLTLDGPSLIPAPGYSRPSTGVIEWIADNTQKGVSAGPAAITVHATGAFTVANLDTSPDEVTRLLLDAARPFLGSAVTASQLHRWRYAKPVADNHSMCLFSDHPAPVAVAGDALAGARVEGAWLSGQAAARRIAAST